MFFGCIKWPLLQDGVDINCTNINLRILMNKLFVDISINKSLDESYFRVNDYRFFNR